MPTPPGVRPAPVPPIEGAILLPDGRRLGYAEYGDPGGRLALWFHGTPGARRQVPPKARTVAAELGLRLVCVERPGAGDSTDHHYERFADWAADVAVVADRLGHERFLVLALSGGGPYAFGVGRRLPERVVAIGLMGSLVPTSGPDAACSSIVDLSRRFNGPLTAVRRPVSAAMWAFTRGVNPLAHAVITAFAGVMPEGDRRVLLDPELEAVFVDDLTVATTHQFRSFVNDAILFGRPWGFRLADVKVPVRWWHGDADPFVPLDDARATVARLPDAELHVRRGESHLGDWAVADEVLRDLAALWDRREPGAARRSGSRGGSDRNAGRKAARTRSRPGGPAASRSNASRS